MDKVMKALILVCVVLNVLSIPLYSVNAEPWYIKAMMGVFGNCMYWLFMLMAYIGYMIEEI